MFCARPLTILQYLYSIIPININLRQIKCLQKTGLKDKDPNQQIRTHHTHKPLNL